MKKGFTLMEVLAVILLLAVVVSFATPVFRAVRFDMKQAQAKTAVKKLAEAVRGYYQVSRGGMVNACFTSGNLNDLVGAACNNPAATGIPQTTVQTPLDSAAQLFACGFLTVKDFRDLPYTFCTTVASAQAQTDGLFPTTLPDPVERFYAVAYANSDSAGKKYFRANNLPGFIYVDAEMTPKDTY